MSPTARRISNSTGPEIWEATGGKIDAFVSAVGTGGTLGGVSLFLKGRNPKIRIGLADVPGAALYNYYAHGDAEGGGLVDHRRHRPGPRHRQPRRTSPVDVAWEIPDAESVQQVFDLVDEGLVMGGSTGVNVAGAIRMARELGPGPHDRHPALRLRQPLRLEAVQPGIPALEGPAGAGMARQAAVDRGAVREGRLMALRDAAALPRRRLPA